MLIAALSLSIYSTEMSDKKLFPSLYKLVCPAIIASSINFAI